MSTQDRKSREFERRGQEILAAALELFQSDDWEGVTVEQIAHKAEVGKGTIYKHFASKDEIYARLAIQFQLRIANRMQEVDPSLPVIERFRCYMEAAWDMHLTSKEMHRVFLYCSRAEFRSRLPAGLLADIMKVERKVATPTHHLVMEGIRQGVFPDKPLALLLFGAQAAFWGAIQLIWSGYLGEIDRSKYLEAMTDFVIAGLVHNARPIMATEGKVSTAQA